MPRKRRGRDEGSLYQREDGQWAASLSLGYDAQGKRLRKTVYGGSKAEVKDKLLALQQDVLHGRPVNPAQLTLDQHFQDWLAVKQPDVRPSTHHNYAGLYASYVQAALGHLKLKDLDYRRINALYAQLDARGLSRRTVALVAFLLRSSLEDAVKKGLLPNNPAKLAASRRQRSRPEAHCLNPDDIRDFLQAAQGERLEAAFIVLLHTGLRIGELLGLSWDAIDWSRQQLTVKQAVHELAGKLWLDEVKTHAGRRTLGLSGTVLAALKHHRKRQAEEQLAAPAWDNPHNLVFTHHQGGMLCRKNLASRDLRRVLHRMAVHRLAGKAPKGRGVKYADVIQQAGLDGISFHTFRHTHASMLIFQGVDAKTIAARLGHTDVAFTLQTYGHLMPGQDAAAAQAVEAFLEKLSR